MIPLASTVSRLSLMLAIVLSAGIVASCQHPDFQEIQTVPQLISPKDNETVYDSVITFSWQHDAQGQEGLVYELWVDEAMVGEVDGNAGRDDYSETIKIPVNIDCDVHRWMVRVHNQFNYVNSIIETFIIELKNPVVLISPDDQAFTCEDEILFQWEDSPCFEYTIRIEKEDDPESYYESDRLTESHFNGYFLEETSYIWYVQGYVEKEMIFETDKKRFTVQNCACSISPIEVHDYEIKPPFGAESALIYDPKQDVFWLYGMSGGASDTIYYLPETWKYDPKTDLWTNMTDLVGIPKDDYCSNTDGGIEGLYIPSQHTFITATPEKIFSLRLDPLGHWKERSNYRNDDYIEWDCGGAYTIGFHEKSNQIFFFTGGYQYFLVLKYERSMDYWKETYVPFEIEEEVRLSASFIYLPHLDQFVYFFGRFSDESINSTHIDTMYLFDPYTYEWSPLTTEGSLPTNRIYGSYIESPCDGTIWFISGLQVKSNRSLYKDHLFWSLTVEGTTAYWKRLIIPSQDETFPAGTQSSALSESGLLLNIDLRVQADEWKYLITSWQLNY